MSYSSIVEMANSPSLIGRVTAAAAAEGIDNPGSWTSSNVWKIVTAPEWGAKWDYARGAYQVNLNADFGIRTDVISDADILAAVRAAQLP